MPDSTLLPVQTLLAWVELLGLLAFAVSGYLEAERREMDPVGHFALSFVTAFGGGTLRDLLIDRRPLFWVVHQEWVLIVLLICLTLPWLTRRRPIREQSRWVQWPDALGLGLFAVSGAAFAVKAGMPLFIASMMGVITATFGGVIRDVVCNEVPRVFQRTELYATCAFVGAWVFLGLSMIDVAQPIAMALGTLTACALRVFALEKGWRLPRVRPSRPRL
ncbi:MAG: trimeric intracellular cation channel family protein [Burkholderiaceae bacterium]